MSYIVGPDASHPDPALKRLDHIICRVPDIELFHSHFRDALGFPEAWPIGRFWPEGRTSGIALGGINLEFIQPDTGVPEPVADTLVFQPTSLETAENRLAAQSVRTRRFDKVEANPDLLALRGFAGEDLLAPQLICRNLLLESPFPVPMFLCDYTSDLKERLSPDNPALAAPYGKVLSVELRLAERGDIRRLVPLGYQGRIALIQTEEAFGQPRITAVKLEKGAVDLKGLHPGFRLI